MASAEHLSDNAEYAVDLGRVSYASPAPNRKMFAVVQREIVAALTEPASCACYCLFAGVQVIVPELDGVYDIEDSCEGVSCRDCGEICGVFGECADAESW